MIARLRRNRGDAGMTLVELLVGAALGVIVMGAVASLVISAVRAQPHITKQAQNITTARWVLGRLTQEIRNGIVVDTADPDELSFRGYVRHSTCGGTGSLPSTSPAIECQITYSCTITACSRRESPPETETGTATQIFSGIDSNQVFTYSPELGPVTYVKITLRLPNPSGTGALTVSDGASLRNATLGY